MNKLLVSNSINLDNGTYNLDCKSKTLDIEISGEVTIYLCNEELENKVSGREICNDIRKSIAKLEKEMDALVVERENINEEVC